MKSPAFAMALLASTVLASAQSVSTISFTNASDLADNFRQVQGAGSTGTTTVVTDTTPNGFASVRADGTAISAYVAVYDTTPGDTADANPTFGGAFTLSMDISAAEANSSFGIYLFDITNSSNNLQALFNLDSAEGAAGNEQIRFWRDANVTVGGVGTAYTTSAITGTNGSFDTGTNSWLTNGATRGAVVTDTSNPFTFYKLSFDYDPTGRTLKVSQGAFSSTLTIPTGDVIVNPAIAVRINDVSGGNTNTAKFDNFSVVPEPSAALLLLSAASVLGLRRRR